MADLSDHAVISYERFREYLERRRGIAGEPPRPPPPTIDADTPPVPNQPPAPVSTAWRQS